MRRAPSLASRPAHTQVAAHRLVAARRLEANGDRVMDAGLDATSFQHIPQLDALQAADDVLVVDVLA